jgi:hypothetical protein
MKLLVALLLIPALILFAACGQATEEPAANAEPADNGQVAAALSADEIDAARQVVYDYWEAFNAYDAEGVFACLEDAYYELRKDEIPGEIGQMQAAKVQLELEEEAEPVVTADGIVVIQIELDVPVLPNRHITYDLIKIDGVWKICGSEEL